MLPILTKAWLPPGFSKIFPPPIKYVYILLSGSPWYLKKKIMQTFIWSTIVLFFGGWGHVSIVYSPMVGPKGPVLVRFHVIKKCTNVF